MNLYSYSAYQRPGVGNQFYWVEIKVQAGLVPPGGPRGEPTLPFRFPVGALLLGLWPFLHFFGHYYVVCGILVTWSGIEPALPAVGLSSLNY